MCGCCFYENWVTFAFEFGFWSTRAPIDILRSTVHLGPMNVPFERLVVISWIGAFALFVCNAHITQRSAVHNPNLPLCFRWPRDDRRFLHNKYPPIITIIKAKATQGIKISLYLFIFFLSRSRLPSRDHLPFALVFAVIAKEEHKSDFL